MDAIIPYSSILLLFSKDDKVEERDSDDLMMEVNFNIQNGKNAGLKQIEFMKKIENSYTLYEGGSLSNIDITDFMDSFINYYENDLSVLSTIRIIEAKVDYMPMLFLAKTDNTYTWSPEEELQNFNEKMDKTSI